MERREVTQYKVFVLLLPSIHGGKAIPVAVFGEKTDLVNFYNDELAEKEWIDTSGFNMQGVVESVRKYFRKGSVLEGCIPISLTEGRNTIDLSYESSKREDNYGMGCIVEEWVTGYPNQEMFEVPYNPGFEPMVVEYET